MLTVFVMWCINVAAQPVVELVERGLKADSAGKYTEAIKLFDQAIALEPALAVLWYNRGVSRMHLKNYSLAVVDFNKTLYLDTAFIDAYYNRSLAYRYTGNYQFALADISTFIQANPNDISFLADRAELAIEIKEWDVAEKDLLQLRNAFLDDSEYAMMLLEVYQQTKKHQAALDVLNAEILRHPEYDFLYISRANVYHNMENYEKSLDEINIFLLNQPQNTTAIKLKADNYFYLKRFQEAAGIYDDLLLKDTANSNLLADYGHCLLQLGQYKKADSILTRSIRSRNESPAYAYLGRGIARFNLGLGNEACEDWWKSSRLGEARAAEYLKNNCSKENK